MNHVFGRRDTMKAGARLCWPRCDRVFWLVPTVGLGDESPAFQKLGDAFRREIRPILDQHCMKCHAADVQEGTLDLEQFATLEDVRRSTTTWLKVAEMLDNGEMPPKKAPQPAPERGSGCAAGSPITSRPRHAPAPATPDRSFCGGWAMPSTHIRFWI